MSSIRISHASFGTISNGDNYTYDTVDGLGLVVSNSVSSQPAVLNVRSITDGYSETAFNVVGNHGIDFTDAEALSLRYNSAKTAYEIHTSASGNGVARPMIFSTHGNSDQAIFQIDGSVLFPQTTDASSAQSASVVFSGGIGVNLSIWGRDLRTDAGVTVGGVLDVASTEDASVVGTGCARFAGGIFAGKSILLGNVVQNRRVVLWSDAGGGINDFIGFGVDTNGVGAAKSLHVQLPGASSQFALFRGSVGGSAEGELFRVTGDGKTKLFGALDVSNFQIKSLAEPTDAFDAVTKRYVDETINNYDPKESVQVATASAVTLTTSIVAGQSIDDELLVAGWRVLVKNQTDAIENGVYVVQASGAPVRAADMAAGSTAGGSFFFVEGGTKYAHMGFMCSASSAADVVGTDALSFVQFSGLGQISAGAGIIKQDNLISTDTDQSHVSKLGNITSGEWKSTPVKVAYGGTGVVSVDVGLILYGNGGSGSTLKSNPAFRFDETALSLKVEGSVYVGRPLSDAPNYLAFAGLSGNGVVSANALNSVLVERHSLSGTLTPTQQSVTELVIFKGSDGTGSTQDDIRVIAGGSIHFETLPPSGVSSYDAISDSFTGNQPIKRLSLSSGALNIAQGVVVTVGDTTVAGSLDSASLVVRGGVSIANDVLLGGAVRYEDADMRTTATGSEYVIESMNGGSTADSTVCMQKHYSSNLGKVSLCVYGTGVLNGANTEGISLTSDGGTAHYLKTLQTGSGTARPVVLMTGANADQLRLETNGSVSYSSSIDASDLTSAAVVCSGGIAVGLNALIGGKLSIGSTLRATSSTEAHELTGSHLLSAVVVIANKNAGGNSVVGFDDANGVRQLSVGYSVGTGSRILSTGPLQLGSSAVFNADGTLTLAHTMDSNATNTNAALSLANGGLYVQKTVTGASLYAKSGGITTVSSPASAHHVLRTAAGAQKRWTVSLTGTEAGSGSGSNYTFSACDDAGVTDSEIAKMYRSDKHIEMFGTMAASGPGTGALRVSGGIFTGADSYFTGSLILGNSLTTRCIDATSSAANLVFQNETLQIGWTAKILSSDNNSLQFRRHVPSTGAYIDSPLILSNDTAEVCVSKSIIHTNTGVGAPTLGNRSSGTRVVLGPDLGTGRSEYAVGLGESDLWISVPSSTQSLDFYAGDQRVYQLSGTGQVSSRSGKAVYNADSLDVGTQAAIFTRYQSENDTGQGDVVASTMTPTCTFTLSSQSATSNMYSVVLPASASSANGTYCGWYIKVRTGSAANQVRRIVTYTGSTRVAGFANSSPWNTTRPGSGDIVDVFENALGAVSFNSMRNEFVLASSATIAMSEIAYCDLRVNRLFAADGFVYAGSPHGSDNITNSPKSSGDRGFVMKRWQVANDASLGDVVGHGTADFDDTVPSQSGHTTGELVFSQNASSTTDAYANWWVMMTSGASVGQVRKISTYNGALRTATLESAWTGQSPDVGSTCSLFAKNEAVVYFDETSNRITAGYTARAPLSSSPGGSLLSTGLADVRVGSLDATGLLSVTGTVAVSSTVTVGVSGRLQTNAGSSTTGNANVHHALGDTTGTRLCAVGLEGAVASGNQGGDYSISMYDNFGTYVSTPLRIKRSTGKVSITTSSRLQSDGAGAFDIAGDLTLSNVTSNMIVLANASNLGAPTYAARSLGTKLVLHSLLGAFSGEFAMGMESQALWMSVPSDTHKFKWYSGTTEIASLNSSGLITNGDVTVSGYFDAGSAGTVMTRVKQFGTLTMPLVDTQALQIPHGVNAAKIVSVTCVITGTIGGGAVYIPPNRSFDGYMYSVLWTNSDIFVIPLAENAASLLGCTASVTMTYQK